MDNYSNIIPIMQGKVSLKILDTVKFCDTIRTMKDYDNFLETTLKLASEATEKTVDICRGAGVKVRWYDKFIRGQIPNPGVVFVQRVYDYLKSKSISDSADG